MREEAASEHNDGSAKDWSDRARSDGAADGNEFAEGRPQADGVESHAGAGKGIGCGGSGAGEDAA